MLDDLRFAIRSLLRARGLAAAAVLCLALGIGGTTTVYSAASALVLHPVPTPDSRGLVMVAEVPPANPSPDDAEMAPANYVDLMKRNRSFSELAAFTGIDANITGIDEPERVSGFRVTPSYFHVLGARPAMGRVFTDDDARYVASPNVVILSDGLWRRRFGGDPDVVGRTVQLNGVPRTIVGVMPAGFVFPPGAELWTPLSTDGAFGRDRDGRTLAGTLARLKPGVSIARANADVHRIMQQLQREYPGDDGKWDMRVESADAFFGRHPRPFMLAQLAAVAFVLLIACANVANLLLARATTRTREIAVRVALGATRARVVRHQLVESLVLALAGGALGVLFAVWGIAVLRAALPPEQALYNPGWATMGVDAGVLAFTAVLSVGTALVVGLVPALVASGTGPHQVLSDGGRASSAGVRRVRLRGLLVTAEMALALATVAGTIATVRGFRALALDAPGYRADHALTLQLTIPITRYPHRIDMETLYERIIDRLRAEPGVEHAAIATALPPDFTEYTQRIYLEGERKPMRADAARRPRWRGVSADYFAAMKIPVLRGRTFTAHDDSTSPPVAVVSEAMARAYWPGREPIGQRLACACDDTTMLTVVGVVADVRYNPNNGTPPAWPTYYQPVAQAHPWRTMSVVVRTAEDPAAMTHRIVAAITSVGPTLAPGATLTLDYLQRSSLSPERLTSGMMASFALVALLLAAIGIHGVTSYTVVQRTHDIGVRTALGARRRDVLRAVLGGTMRFVAAGLVVGILGALLLTRALSHLLTQISAGGALPLVGAAAVLVVAALVGGYLPARRAMRIDPLVALRSE